MNRERATVRARSIVGLYREETVATLPIEEVRADLDRLGVNSAETIDLARRLASGGDDDLASGLLARLEQADAADCEIADIERQSMQRILDVLPSDLVDSAKTTSDDLASKTKPVEPDREDDEEETKATDTKIKAEIETLDVAFRPKRRLRSTVIGIGGSAVAIAASVFLTFTVRPDVLDQFEWSGDLGAAFEKWSISTWGGDDQHAAPEVETALAESDGAVLLSQPDVRQRSVPEPPAQNVPLSSDDALSAGLADVQPQDSGRAARPVVSALALDDQTAAAANAGIASTDAGVPALNVSALDAAETGPTVNGSTTLPDNLIGVFILDAERAPQELVALESVGRDNRLGAKRGEASLRALGRRVFALIAFERGGERIEAAVIEAKPDASASARPAVAGFEASTQSGFELLELSQQR